MGESQAKLSEIQARNVADAERAGRVIYDRAGVRQLLIGGEHAAPAWEPPHRKKQAQGHAGRDKAIHIRVNDRERSFASMFTLGPDQSHDSDEILPGSLEAQLRELGEFRAVAITIVDKAWCEGVEDFDLADAALDAIEDLDITLRETIAAIVKSTAPVPTSE